jgi:hypothetical protein
MLFIHSPNVSSDTVNCLLMYSSSTCEVLNGRNPDSLSHCHTVHCKSWGWTKVSVKKGRRLSSWVTVRPYLRLHTNTNVPTHHVSWHSHIPINATYLFHFLDCSQVALSCNLVLLSTVCSNMLLAIWVQYVTAMWTEQYSFQTEILSHKIYLRF